MSALLAAVGLGDTGAPGTWVAADGHFRIGGLDREASCVILRPDPACFAVSGEAGFSEGPSMPGLDLLSGTFALPWWTLIAAVFLIVILWLFGVV